MSFGHQNGNVAENGARTEQALSASELSYRRLFEAAKDGILILDFATGCITDANPFLCKLLGFSHSEMVGQTVGELSPFKDIVTNQAMFKLLQEHGYVRYEDLPLESKDGRKIAVEFVSNVYQAGDKQVIQCNVRDITERKSAETGTRKLLAIVETSPDFIGFSSLEGSIEYLNPEGRKMVGLDQEKSVRSTMILDYVHETDRERFQNQVVPVLFRDGHWDGETLFKNFRTGAAIPTWQRIFFITEPGTDQRKNIATIVRDITESKKTEEHLQLQGRALEAAANAMVITDSKGVIEWVNPAFTAYTGYSAAEAIGKNARLLKSGKNDAKFYQNLWQTVIAGKVWHGELINRRKDGTLYDEDMTITPMRDINGEIAHFIAIKQDITKRKEAEEQLLLKTTFLEAQVNSSLDGILIIDREGKKLLQNQRMIDLWNIPREIADEADDQRQREWVISQVKNSRQFTEDIANLEAHPDEIIHAEVELIDGRVIDRYSAPVVGNDGKRYGRIRAFRDITERRREEENLRRFATVVRDSNDAITIQDFDGRITAWNHGAELMYGYGENEALLMNIERLTASDKVAEQKEFICRLVAGEAITSFETLRVTKDGRVLNVWMTVTKLLDEAGNPIGLASTERDITERKRAEEQIAEQAAFLDKARDAIIVRDLDGKLLYWNKGAEHIYGWTSQEALGRNVLELLDTDPKKFEEAQRS